jgi:hypothetical protein
MREAQDARMRADGGSNFDSISTLAHAAQFNAGRETARQQRKAGGAGRGGSTDGWLPFYAEGDAA